MSNHHSVANLVELLGRCKCVFVGGAPRSGTTLMLQLLDGHSRVLALPVEMTFIVDFWKIDESEREHFANSFLFDTKYQESLFVNENYRRKRRIKKIAEMDDYVEVDTDPAQFIAAYQAVLAEAANLPCFSRILYGLSIAYLKSSDSIKRICVEPTLLIFKMPYYVELYARNIEANINNAYFIHLLRDPIQRFLSAKKRRVKSTRTGNRQVARVNFENFVVGICQVTFSSQKLAIENGNMIGSYSLVLFEELVRNDFAMMKEIASACDLDFQNSLRQPTRMGVTVRPNTAFWKGGGDGKENAIQDKFIELTNERERHYLMYLCGIGNYDRLYDHFCGVKSGSGEVVSKFRYERWRDYGWRLSQRFGRIRTIAEYEYILRDLLPLRIYEGKAGVSGAS